MKSGGVDTKGVHRTNLKHVLKERMKIGGDGRDRTADLRVMNPSF